MKTFWIDPRLLGATISRLRRINKYHPSSSIHQPMASGSWRGSGKPSPSKAKRTRSAMRGSSGTRPMEAQAVK